MSERAQFVVFTEFRDHTDIADFPTALLIRCNCGHLAWMPPDAIDARLTRYTFCSYCFEQHQAMYQANRLRLAHRLKEALRRNYGVETMEDVINQLRAMGILGDDE